MHKRLILAVAIALFAVSNAFAQGETYPITPHKPVLTKNADAALCGAFASAWMEVFRGERKLDGSWLDLQAAFPEAEIFSYPRERRSNGGFMGLYNTSYQEALDFDGDGDTEILHIESQDMGWRYLGVGLYLFETEAEFEKVKAVSEKSLPRRDTFVGLVKNKLDSPPLGLLSFPPASVVYVISLNGAVYATASPYDRGRGESLSTSVVHLNASGGPQEVCTLDLLPDYSDARALLEDVAFFQALRDIYGGPDGCMGSMGWTAPPLERHLLKIFHRPQSMGDGFRHIVPDPKHDPARELRLLVWGLEDPTSWSVYKQLKRSWPSFVDHMAGYYRRHLAMPESEATQLAERAYRYLIDRLIYAHNLDAYRVTGVAHHSRGSVPITMVSTPEEVAAVAIEYLLQIKADTDAKPRVQDERIWRDAVLAAIFVGQDTARVRQLWERLGPIFASIANSPYSEDAKGRKDAEERAAALRRATLNDMLLAALGDQALTELVMSFGAQVDAPTNWFRKTPLMYAAQGDDLAAAKLLLGKGADPSIQTSATGQNCHDLQRDGRTPLMYAAENASPELIEFLADAGADVALADTQGNTALWYLERNEHLNEAEKAPLRQRLNPDR